MRTVADIMTPNPTMLEETDSIVKAAQMMRDQGIGDVLVGTDGAPSGIVTDRDIVVRALADARDPERTTVGDILSRELVTASPSDDADHVVALMRDKALRRVPVVEDGRAIGIVSLGDLAEEKDPDSVLADISEAPPTT